MLLGVSHFSLLTRFLSSSVTIIHASILYLDLFFTSQLWIAWNFPILIMEVSTFQVPRTVQRLYTSAVKDLCWRVHVLGSAQARECGLMQNQFVLVS